MGNGAALRGVGGKARHGWEWQTWCVEARYV
jgi:hypothetical protein